MNVRPLPQSLPRCHFTLQLRKEEISNKIPVAEAGESQTVQMREGKGYCYSYRNRSRS